MSKLTTLPLKSLVNTLTTLCAIGLVTISLVSPVQASDWSGSVDDFWNTPGNWVGGAAPVPADDVYVGPFAPTSDELVFLNGDVEIKNLTLSNGAEIYTGMFDLNVNGLTLLDETAGDVLLQIDQDSTFTTDRLRIENGAELGLAGGSVVVTGNPFFVDAASAIRTDVLGGSISMDNLVLEGTFRSAAGNTQITGTSIAVGSMGNFNVNSATDPTTVSVTASNFDVISGARMDIGGAATSTLVIVAAAQFDSGSNIHLTNKGRLQLDGTANFDSGATLFFFDDDTEVIVNGQTTINISNFDWDGPGGVTTTVNEGALLDINVDTLESPNDRFGGTLNVNGGTVDVDTTSNSWRLRGPSTLNLTNSGGNAPTIAGDLVEMRGTTNVSGLAVISAESRIYSVAGVSLPDVGDELQIAADSTVSGGSFTGDGKLTVQAEFDVINNDVTIDSGFRTETYSSVDVHSGLTLNLNGPTEYAGGSHGAEGSITQTGDAVVSDSTEIASAGTGHFDWDGADENSKTYVMNGQTFTIAVDSFEEVHNGTIELDGGTVRTFNTGGTGWESAGSIVMHTLTDHGGDTPTIQNNDPKSERLTISGTLDAIGEGHALIDSDLDMASTSTTHVESGVTLHLGSDVSDSLNLDGAHFSGTGTVNLNGEGSVTGNTVVNMDADTGVFDLDGINGPGASYLMTVDFLGSLEINASSIDDNLGGFSAGTIDVRGVMAVNTPAPWHIVDGGELELTQTHPSAEPTLNGSQLVVDPNSYFYVDARSTRATVNAPVDLQGYVDITGGSVVDFNADTRLASSLLTLASSTSFINLHGATQWAGGTYVGDGEIWQYADADITESTTLEFFRYQWDGAGGTTSSNTTVRSGATFKIMTHNIDYFDNSYEGHVTIEDMATLDVSTHTPQWRLGGTATLEGAPIALPKAIITGVEMIIDPEGTLEGNGRILSKVTNFGTVAPGLSAGTILISNDYDQLATGVLEIELGGLAPITEYDVLEVFGMTNLDGTLAVSLIDGFVPSVGDTFEIVNGSPISGIFSNELLPTLSAGMELTTVYNTNSVRLMVIEVPIPGDLDGDGFVGINDLNLVLSDWNKSVPPADPRADPTGDGYVGIGDLNTVLSNWNLGEPPSVTVATVPEPSSLALVVGIGVYLASERRRST